MFPYIGFMSLHAAIDDPRRADRAAAPSRSRYVVFAVSGTIELKSDLVIRNPYLTIAGQSAPGQGVQIRNWGLKIRTHDVILRHLRVRVRVEDPRHRLRAGLPAFVALTEARGGAR